MDKYLDEGTSEEKKKEYRELFYKALERERKAQWTKEDLYTEEELKSKA